MKIIGKTEIDEPTFEDIMTTNIIYFEDLIDIEREDFCERRNITYLPSKTKTFGAYKFSVMQFKFLTITKTQKILYNKKIFDEDILKIFKKSEILFIYDSDELKGIVHFCDYNRDPVFIYLYSLILKYKKDIISLLIEKGMTNQDMIKFFDEHRDNEHYMKKLKKCMKDDFKFKEIEPFQLFELSDLISLLSANEIIKISNKVIELRNHVMHFKNPIKHQDYELETLIYNFQSFENFIINIEIFNKEREKIKKCLK